MSVSFREFFMDNSIPGHTLFRTFHRRVRMWLPAYSPLPIERHSRLLEVIQRIVLGIFFPLLLC